MKLRRLELSGFKSFADTIEVQIGDGVTSIIGPNGCGKSNVSDAVRWVLGEHNPRVLRGARMEEVIFQGSSGRRPQNIAEVMRLTVIEPQLADAQVLDMYSPRHGLHYRKRAAIDNFRCRSAGAKL